MPPQYLLLGESEFEEFDLYWIFRAGGVVSKESRKILKDLGWRSQRHTRTKKEIWVFEKEAAVREYFAKLKEETL